jgi:hypothetical protein
MEESFMGESIHHSIFRRKGIGDVIRRLARGLHIEAASAKAVAINPQSNIAAA